MFRIAIVSLACMGAFWEVLRIHQAKKQRKSHLILLFILFLGIWMIPVLIKDRGPFSGFVYTAFYYALYFIFILNFFYTCFIGLRDFFWILLGIIYKKKYALNKNWSDWKNPVLIRRTGYVALSLAGIISLVALNAGIKVPNIKEIHLQTDKTDTNLTIVALNDLHIHRTVSVDKIKKIVEQVNALQPDIIVLVGDTIDDYATQIQPHLKALTQLKAPKGIFATAGNHEFYVGHEESKKALTDNGITYLFNEGVNITPQVFLAGVPDYRSVKKIDKFASAVQALKDAPEENYKILLSHRPDMIDTLKKEQIDLQISGHTHGGQIFPMHLLTAYFNRYLSGLYTHENGLLYVSNGAGQWGPQMRFLAPSEISVIRLKSLKPTAQQEKTTPQKAALSVRDKAKPASLNKNKIEKSPKMKQTPPVKNKTTSDNPTPTAPMQEKETQPVKTATEKLPVAESNSSTDASLSEETLKETLSDLPALPDLTAVSDNTLSQNTPKAENEEMILPDSSFETKPIQAETEISLEESQAEDTANTFPALTQQQPVLKHTEEAVAEEITATQEAATDSLYPLKNTTASEETIDNVPEEKTDNVSEEKVIPTDDQANAQAFEEAKASLETELLGILTQKKANLKPIENATQPVMAAQKSSEKTAIENKVVMNGQTAGKAITDVAKDPVRPTHTQLSAIQKKQAPNTARSKAQKTYVAQKPHKSKLQKRLYIPTQLSQKNTTPPDIIHANSAIHATNPQSEIFFVPHTAAKRLFKRYTKNRNTAPIQSKKYVIKKTIKTYEVPAINTSSAEYILPNCLSQNEWDYTFKSYSD